MEWRKKTQTSADLKIWTTDDFMGSDDNDNDWLH